MCVIGLPGSYAVCLALSEISSSSGAKLCWSLFGRQARRRLPDMSDEAEPLILYTVSRH